ncbi:E2 ligase fold family C protein [Methanococcoides sp. SA1]|nr:E2 ligase fold family C protein [Methanococcoides sp. SA1]
MALASYFSKDVLAFSQVLKKTTNERFESILSSHIVEIAFDNSIKDGEGSISLDLTIRLLSRLYPKIKISDLTNENQEIVEKLIEKALAINSNIEITQETPTISLVIGSTALANDNLHQIIYIGSDYWIAKLSLENPIGSGSSNLPFAAGASVCIGVSNVFRFVFKELIDDCEFDNDVNLSLINLNQTTEFERNDIDQIDIDGTILVGFGAIGNGFIWALSNTPNIKGRFTVIDPEKIELSNLQRYCLAEEKHIEIFKVQIAENLFRDTELELNLFEGDWAEYLNSNRNWNNELVCIGVDSAKDRIAIQSSLPKSILNAYTEKNLIGITRHSNFVESACLSCGFIPKQKVESYSLTVAKNLKIPSQERLIRDYLYSNIPVDRKLLGLVAEANSVEISELLQYEGENISNFYSTVVCGGYLLSMSISNDEAIDIEAPLAFQSTFAGILLASELVLSKLEFRSTRFKNHTQLHPLHPLKKDENPYNHTSDKDETGRCICNDEDFKKVYMNKWNESKA